MNRRNRPLRSVILPLSAAVALSLFDSAEAAQISWRTNFRKASREASRSKKPMLVEITATWCGYCHKMLEETFSNQQIARNVNDCFVPVNVDADENKKIVQAIGIEALPTTVIISPKMKILKKITGYRSAQQIRRHLKPVCRRTRKKAGQKPIAGSAPPKPPQSKNSAGPFAFDGYCLVSLVDEKDLQPGSAEHTATYQGRTLRFHSKAARKKFEANPAKYWPVNDGRCPVSAVDEERPQQGNPETAALYRGRLVFFADGERRRQFAQDPAAYWPGEKN